MTNFVNSSALTKLLANFFLFVTLITLLAIGVYDTLHGTPVPQYIITVLGGAIGYALTLLGVHVGSVTATQISQPAPAATTTITTATAAQAPHDVVTQPTQQVPVPPIHLAG